MLFLYFLFDALRLTRRIDAEDFGLGVSLALREWQWRKPSVGTYLRRCYCCAGQVIKHLPKQSR